MIKDDIGGDEVETPLLRHLETMQPWEKRVIMVQEARTKTFWRG
jgi:hypothetical protein